MWDLNQIFTLSEIWFSSVPCMLKVKKTVRK